MDVLALCCMPADAYTTHTGANHMLMFTYRYKYTSRRAACARGPSIVTLPSAPPSCTPAPCSRGPSGLAVMALRSSDGSSTGNVAAADRRPGGGGGGLW